MHDVCDDKGLQALKPRSQLLAEEGDEEAVGEKQLPLPEGPVGGLHVRGQREENALDHVQVLASGRETTPTS